MHRNLHCPVFILMHLTSEMLKTSVKCIAQTHLTEDINVVSR